MPTKAANEMLGEGTCETPRTCILDCLTETLYELPTNMVTTALTKMLKEYSNAAQNVVTSEKAAYKTNLAAHTLGVGRSLQHALRYTDTKHS